MLATFAMGTALGDVTAYSLHMGYLASIALFALAILLPGAGAAAGLNAVATFWSAYVLTRPLGASLADHLGFPGGVGGRGWGHGTVALVFGVAIALGIARALAAHNRQRRVRAIPVGRAGTSPRPD